jgi:hypothetical protein
MGLRRALILILLLGITFSAILMHGARAQSGTPSAGTAPSPSPADGSNTDKPPPWDVTGRAEFAINSWFRGLVASALDPVFRLLGKTLLATPRLDLHPRIRDLWRFSLGIANAALVLFVLAGSGIVMVGGLSSQLTVKELLPRLLGAAVAVNFALPLAGQLIVLANGLTLALLGTAADDVSPGLSELVFAAGLDTPLFLIFGLVVLILAVLVIVAFVIRVATLVVLLAGGPLLLVTHALPQTDHVARTWWRLMLAMVAAPVFQAFVLTAAAKVFLTGGVLALGSGGGLIDLLVIGCLLYLLYRIPLWTMHLALRGAGSRAWATTKHQTVVAIRSAVSGGAA